jgi:hypothetical protein
MENRNVKISISRFFLSVAVLLILIVNPLTVKYVISQKGTIGNGVTFILLAFDMICAVYVLITLLAVSSYRKGKAGFLNRHLNFSLLIFFIVIVLLLVETSFRTVFKSFLHYRPFEYSELFGVEWIKPGLDIVSESPEYKATFKTNKYGFRSGFDFSPKKENEIRIITTGDSYIMAGEMDFENTMSRKLEKYLNENQNDKIYTVINTGKSGLSQNAYRIFFERNLKLFNADYLIMFIYVGNDIEDEMTIVKYSEEDPNFFRNVFNTASILLTRYSYFFRYIDERLISKIYINHPPGGPCQPFDNLPQEKSKNVFLKNYNNKINTGFDNMFKNTLELARICRENNVRFMVGTIPTKEQAEKDNLNRLIDFYKIDTATLDMRKPQKVISDFLNQNQIINIDLLDTLAEASKTGRTYLNMDSHWSIYGNDVAAKKINAFLKNNILKN